MSYNLGEESIILHKKIGGKLEIASKIKIQNKHDLSLAYTPGVASVCQKIYHSPNQVYELTIKKNSVAIVTDGSAVLGLGNIGAESALPVMEGKALLFKEYANIDAYPICLNTQDKDEIIKTIRYIAPGFGGINLEDISAPRCFEIESELQDLGIPVFHDDQHGTAIVLLSALINSAKLVNKPLESLNVVINGAGAAGTAIANILLGNGYNTFQDYKPVSNVIICDSKGIISKDRTDIQSNPTKLTLAKSTNKKNIQGTLSDAIKNADVFVGVSVAGALTPEMIQTMNTKPIIFAMANPIPEIMPNIAKQAGAFIIGTGRSDFENQVNNVLAFPGIFRSALDIRAKQITPDMKITASLALANAITPTVNEILPSPLDKSVAYKIAQAISSLNTQKKY